MSEMLGPIRGGLVAPAKENRAQSMPDRKRDQPVALCSELAADDSLRQRIRVRRVQHDVRGAVALRQVAAILRRELIFRVRRGQELQLRAILELDVLVPDAVVMRPAGFQRKAHGAIPARGRFEVVDQDDDVVEAGDERGCLTQGACQWNGGQRQQKDSG